MPLRQPKGSWEASVYTRHDSPRGAELLAALAQSALSWSLRPPLGQACPPPCGENQWAPQSFPFFLKLFSEQFQVPSKLSRWYRDPHTPAPTHSPPDGTAACVPGLHSTHRRHLKSTVQSVASRLCPVGVDKGAVPPAILRLRGALCPRVCEDLAETCFRLTLGTRPGQGRPRRLRSRGWCPCSRSSSLAPTRSWRLGLLPRPSFGNGLGLLLKGLAPSFMSWRLLRPDPGGQAAAPALWHVPWKPGSVRGNSAGVRGLRPPGSPGKSAAWPWDAAAELLAGALRRVLHLCSHGTSVTVFPCSVSGRLWHLGSAGRTECAPGVPCSPTSWGCFRRVGIHS